MTWTYHRFSPGGSSAQVAEAGILAGLNKLSPEQGRTALTALYHDDGGSGARHPVLIYNDSPDAGAHARDLPLEWAHVQYNFAKGYDETLGAVCDLLNGKPLQLSGETVTLNPSQASLATCVMYHPPITPSAHLAVYYPKSIKENPMTSDNFTAVGGHAHSGDIGQTVVVANIGKKGTRFAGTFNGRTSVGTGPTCDFIMSVYTDKNTRLYLVYVAGDRKVEAVEKTHQSSQLHLDASTLVGTVTYNPESGDLSITRSQSHWFQGALTGMFTKGA